MLQLKLSVLRVLVISVLPIATVLASNDSVTLPMEYPDTVTVVGPGNPIKKSILYLNIRLENDTKEAFHDVNNNLQAGQCGSSEALSYPTTFSNELGSVENLFVSGLAETTLEELETDIYRLRTQFNLQIPNITVNATVMIANVVQTNIGSNNKNRTVRATLKDLVIIGSSALYVRQLKNQNYQIAYRKFVGKQKLRTFQMVGEQSFDESNESMLEEQIEKSLIRSALEKVLESYLKKIQQSANTRLKTIDLELYIPGIVEQFFQVIKETQTNLVVNGPEFLSELYTGIVRDWINKQDLGLPPVSRPIRRKTMMLEGTWVYGQFELFNGTSKGLQDVNISVGSAISGIEESVSNGVVKFGPLSFSYDYLILYAAGGHDEGNVTLSMDGFTANFTERNGVKLLSVTLSNFTFQQLVYNGPEQSLILRGGQSNTEFRETTFEGHIKNSVKQKITTIVNDGLREVYF